MSSGAECVCVCQREKRPQYEFDRFSYSAQHIIQMIFVRKLYSIWWMLARGGERMRNGARSIWCDQNHNIFSYTKHYDDDDYVDRHQQPLEAFTIEVNCGEWQYCVLFYSRRRRRRLSFFGNIRRTTVWARVADVVRQSKPFGGYPLFTVFTNTIVKIAASTIYSDGTKNGTNTSVPRTAYHSFLAKLINRHWSFAMPNFDVFAMVRRHSFSEYDTSLCQRQMIDCRLL